MNSTSVRSTSRMTMIFIFARKWREVSVTASRRMLFWISSTLHLARRKQSNWTTRQGGLTWLSQALHHYILLFRQMILIVDPDVPLNNMPKGYFIWASEVRRIIWEASLGQSYKLKKEIPKYASHESWIFHIFDYAYTQGPLFCLFEWKKKCHFPPTHDERENKWFCSAENKQHLHIFSSSGAFSPDLILRWKALVRCKHPVSEENRGWVIFKVCNLSTPPLLLQLF